MPRARRTDRTETRRRTYTKREPRKPRAPRTPKPPPLEKNFHDTIRVVTHTGTEDYTDAAFLVDGDNGLLVVGTRATGEPYPVAYYPPSTWYTALTIVRADEPPVAKPTPTPAPTPVPAPTPHDI